MALEVEDNQTVRAGDVLFRIDDRDYRAHLAQAIANVKATEARLTNVDAETQLQHALIRQAQAQHQSAVIELDLAINASDCRRGAVCHRGGHANVISRATTDGQRGWSA